VRETRFNEVFVMDSTTYLNKQNFIDMENEFVANNYKPLDVVFAQGQGVGVWDVKGHKVSRYAGLVFSP
jgi:ornithine--oxo-acid transaminase